MVESKNFSRSEAEAYMDWQSIEKEHWETKLFPVTGGILYCFASLYELKVMRTNILIVPWFE